MGDGVVCSRASTSVPASVAPPGRAPREPPPGGPPAKAPGKPPREGSPGGPPEGAIGGEKIAIYARIYA